MTVLISNNDRAQKLYGRFIEKHSIDTRLYSLVIVQHVVPNSIPLFNALRHHFHITSIIPKRSSLHDATLSQLESFDPPFPILHCTRDQIRDPDYVSSHLVREQNNHPLLFLDVGGYFARSVDSLHSLLGDRLFGIIEDTENGHQKYDAYVEKIKQKGRTIPCPIFSVARSPLKEPEDYLVGQSVLFSVERVLRENNSLLTNKVVLVIGYGKIGKSIASSLCVRNITVWIYDQDPIKRAQALSHGFHTPEREMAIRNADLIIGASGNKSLRPNDFVALKSYCFVASVTSADDEFDLGEIRKIMAYRDTKRGVEVFYNDKKVFHLINEGNAINFLYNNVLGTYIYLVACEIIECIMKTIINHMEIRRDKISTLTVPERQAVANEWLKEFSNSGVY